MYPYFFCEICAKKSFSCTEMTQEKYASERKSYFTFTIHICFEYFVLFNVKRYRANAIECYGMAAARVREVLPSNLFVIAVLVSVYFTFILLFINNNNNSNFFLPFGDISGLSNLSRSSANEEKKFVAASPLHLKDDDNFCVENGNGSRLTFPLYYNNGTMFQMAPSTHTVWGFAKHPNCSVTVTEVCKDNTSKRRSLMPCLFVSYRSWQ